MVEKFRVGSKLGGMRKTAKFGGRERFKTFRFLLKQKRKRVKA